jgi:hypothetical protein
MPAYEIYVLCNECNREHPILMKIHLDQGPDRKQSIAEFFGGGAVPPQVTPLKGHKALCLRTGRIFRLERDDQIFLVPPTVRIFPHRQLPLMPDAT